MEPAQNCRQQADGPYLNQVGAFFGPYWKEQASVMHETFCMNCFSTMPRGTVLCPACGGDVAALTSRSYCEKLVRDTQAGRVRYDFAQRLEKSAREFKVKILQRTDVAIEGIENAMQKGAAISRANAVEFEQINTALSARTRKLDEIRGRLVAVMKCTGLGIG